jgi:hypothetical protein
MAAIYISFAVMLNKLLKNLQNYEIPMFAPWPPKTLCSLEWEK